MKYCLLGDDILIRDDRIHQLYLELLHDLGVEFSAFKTHDSPHFFEIAKRLFLRDEEVSPFPISALKESSKRYYTFIELLSQQRDRGIPFPKGLAGSVDQFLGIVKELPSRVRSKVVSKAFLAEVIANAIKGKILDHEFLGLSPLICEKFSLPDLQVTRSEFFGILENIAVEAFADSNPVNYKGRKPSVGLGPLSISLVEILTDESKIDPAVGFEVIYALPILGAYAQVEEKYITLTKQATTYKDWPILLRTMALPLDDRVFYTRSSDLVVQMFPKIISMFGERLKILQMYPQLR